MAARPATGDAIRVLASPAPAPLGSGRPGLQRASALIVWLAVTTCVATGCLSPRYRHAGKKTPPAVALNVSFPPAPLQATLDTLIISGGPGSWKRQAFWDEYVVTFHNAGEQPLRISSARLVDAAGTALFSGDDPWGLERQSKSLARRYRDAGTAFARMAAPRVLVTAAEPQAVAAAGVGTAGAAAAATATAVALPVYAGTVLGINIHNKKAIAGEFNRRRLPLPMALDPGQSKTGSLFFPMVPNPRSLSVRWSNGSGGSPAGGSPGRSDSREGEPDRGASEGNESVLPLEFLQGLHVKEARAK